MKNLKTIIGIALTSSVLSLTGCVEKFEADISQMPIEGLVVEGNIISDSTVVFHLNKELPLYVTEDNEDLFEDYLNVDAELTVKGSDGSSWTGLPLGKGQYQVRIGSLKEDVEYHVEITYGGDVYHSEPQKPLRTVGIADVSFQQPDLEGPVMIHLDTQEAIGDDPKYYLWYFEEDWEVRAEFVTSVLYDYETDKIVRYDYPPVARGWCHRGAAQFVLGTTESSTLNHIADRELHHIENDDHRLSVLYSIRVFQRTLTRQEYEYYQVRAKLNSGMGGLFTPQPSELPTNIICSHPGRKVIGYVGCNMGVAQNQLYIPTTSVAYVDDDDCDHGGAPDGTYRDKYMAGYQICDDSYVWARVHCVDVTRLGADPMGCPSWWPEIVY